MHAIGNDNSTTHQSSTNRRSDNTQPANPVSNNCHQIAIPASGRTHAGRTIAARTAVVRAARSGGQRRAAQRQASQRRAAERWAACRSSSRPSPDLTNPHGVQTPLNQWSANLKSSKLNLQTSCTTSLEGLLGWLVESCLSRLAQVRVGRLVGRCLSRSAHCAGPPGYLDVFWAPVSRPQS